MRFFTKSSLRIKWMAAVAVVSVVAVSAVAAGVLHTKSENSSAPALYTPKLQCLSSARAAFVDTLLATISDKSVFLFSTQEQQQGFTAQSRESLESFRENMQKARSGFQPEKG